MAKKRNTKEKAHNKNKTKKNSATKKLKTATMKKSKPKTNNKKETKKSSATKELKATTIKKSNSKKENKEKETKKTKTSSKETPKNNSKPRPTKKYDSEEIDLIEKDPLIDEEVDEGEIEEIDINNIEPVISDTEPLIEDDEEEHVPKTRGRKKQIQPEVHHQSQTLEEIIRSRPLQIDPTQKTYVTKKEDEPKPFISTQNSVKERYSDEELQEFKTIILQKLKETKENYDQLKKFFTHQDDNGTDDTSPTFKMIEDGSDVMTKEEIEQQLARLEKYMIDLQNALLRIENKTYGICTVTGKLIPKERLRSVPHATKSIEVKINRNI